MALEAPGDALAIAEIVRPHVGAVALANPQATRGESGNGRKTDKIDARSLARLLATGFLPVVWAPDAQSAACATSSRAGVNWSSSARVRRTRSTRSCTETSRAARR